MRLPKNRLTRFALYAVSIVVILIAVDLALIRIYARVHPGPDTTVLTSPTLPDGRIDYLAALDAPFAAGVTPENNAAIPLIQAFGPKQVLLQRDRASAALGLPPTPDDENHHFIDFDAYFKAQHPGAALPDISPLREHPWDAASHTDAAAWLDRNAPYLDLLHQASLRTRYYYPYGVGTRPDVLAALLLPDVPCVRKAVKAFLTRAMLRAGAGDADGAADDLVTVHRLAALFEQSPISIAHLVAAAANVGASRAARAMAPGLTAPQLRTLADALDRLPPPAPAAPVVDRERRFLYLDELQYVARQSPRRAVWSLSTLVYPRGHADDWRLIARCCFPIDYDAHLRAVNGLFDRLEAALNEPTYPARQAALRHVAQSAGSLPYLLRTAAFFSRANVGRMVSGGSASDVVIAQRLLTRVAVALALYKSDTGHYPASLADLASKYLPNVPTDPYTLKPLIYHPTPAGYTLTSAGPNMTDDGGRGDDLVASVP